MDLIKQRGIIKARLTRFQTYLNSEKIEQYQLKVRLDKFKEAWTEFDNIQTKIEIETGEDTEREKFEDEYFELMGKANELLTKVQQSDEISLTKVTSRAPNIVQLPKINLPKFKGEYEEYQSFQESFKSLIETHSNLDDIQKFQYLKSCLEDDAAKLIASLELTGKNYTAAWELLERRYNQKRLIVFSHISAIFALVKTEKESACHLRNVMDTTLKHLRALSSLDIDTKAWDVLIIYIITSKLDYRSLRGWEETCPKDKIPTLDDFFTFLEQRAVVLENVNHGSNSKQRQNKITDVSKSAQLKSKSYSYGAVSEKVNSSKLCHICKRDNHHTFKCKALLGLPVAERLAEVTKNKLCINCLLPNTHKLEECKFGTCKICKLKHNTLLHSSRERSQKYVAPITDNRNTSVQEDYLSQTQSSKKNSTTSSYCHVATTVLLSTAVVQVYDALGQTHLCRALLDSGSQANFITEEIANKLGFRKKKYVSKINGIANSCSTVSASIQCTIQSRVSNYSCDLECLVVPQITCAIPQLNINISKWILPPEIQLADPNFNKSGKIDILIGAQVFYNLLCIGRINPTDKWPHIQKTQFGWVVSGNVNVDDYDEHVVSTSCHLSFNNSKLEQQLIKFWHIEHCASRTSLSPEERHCEELFQKTTKRDDDGRFTVQLPLKEGVLELGESEYTATKRFLQLEKKLNYDTKLKEAYSKFMKEYEDLNHMELVPSSELKQTKNMVYYIPHHGVHNAASSTTKLRVVFDASSKSSTGISLNNAMMVGATVQDTLFSIVLRFRKYKYVFTADISKMYRQINIITEQRDLQRIIWRENPSVELKTYRLRTVTYGTAAAPFLATRCLKQVAQENEKYATSSRIISEDFYVDDLMTGHDSLKEALKIQREVITILKSAGFVLHKWCSNSTELLSGIPLEHREAKFIPNDDKHCAIKALGLWWSPVPDQFQFTIKPIKYARLLTKRIVLADIAHIFDPLGLLSPVVIRSKIFMQKLWELKLDWDDELPTTTSHQWFTFRAELNTLENLRIPRRVVGSSYIYIDLCGFSDASESAYGACLYLRCKDSLNHISINLLCSKSRVAPLRKTTVPRLELCAALLLAQLYSNVQESFKLEFRRNILWTDSTIVLAWLQSPSSNWKTFVANRVAEIHELTPGIVWKHISSADNPADLVSRGINPSEIINNNMWWNGPEWLSKPSSTWPSSKIAEVNLPERKEIITVGVATLNVFLPIITKFSSLRKLKGVIAYCFRFLHNAKGSSQNRRTGILTAEELENALFFCIKVVQRETWPKEFRDLETKNYISSKSKLLSLSPILDSSGMLRVGGRLKNSLATPDCKHPLLLPKHHLTSLIMEHEHKKQLHAGAQMLLTCIRQRFWPINGRNLARQIIHKCLICYRATPKPANQLMGNLPTERVVPARAFLNAGVDYCGPIYISSGRRRGSRKIKAYIAIFVCLATKAVHVELVGDLTTESFLGALRRFFSRRGRSAKLVSDNATNFVGAANELKTLFANKEFQTKLYHTLSEENITWQFIPPKSPHFGGLWEAAVKALKYHLRRVVGDASLTYEELYTNLTLIEACLNSRPLCPLSSDPNDLSSLTPGHFLIGESLTGIPEMDIRSTNINRLSRWQRVQQLAQHFWNRWSREYLGSLQQRPKWKKLENNLQMDQLVLLKEPNLSPLQWRLGRIIKLYPDKDGRVRVVDVKTAAGIYKRAIANICPLPQE